MHPINCAKPRREGAYEQLAELRPNRIDDKAAGEEAFPIPAQCLLSNIVIIGGLPSESHWTLKDAAD
jgi:hypothetical protein